MGQVRRERSSSMVRGSEIEGQRSEVGGLLTSDFWPLTSGSPAFHAIATAGLHFDGEGGGHAENQADVALSVDVDFVQRFINGDSGELRVVGGGVQVGDICVECVIVLLQLRSLTMRRVSPVFWKWGMSRHWAAAAAAASAPVARVERRRK